MARGDLFDRLRGEARRVRDHPKLPDGEKDKLADLLYEASDAIYRLEEKRK